MSFCRLSRFIRIKWVELLWPVHMIQTDGIGDEGRGYEGSQQAQWLGDSCLLLNLGELSSGLCLTIPALNQTILITPMKAKIDCLCNCLQGLDKSYVNVVPTEEKLRTPSFTLTSHTDSSLLTRPSPESSPLYSPDFTLMDILQKLLLVSIAEKVFLGGGGHWQLQFLGFLFFPKSTGMSRFPTPPLLFWMLEEKNHAQLVLSDLWRISKATDVIDMKRKKKNLQDDFLQALTTVEPPLKKISHLFAQKLPNQIWDSHLFSVSVLWALCV